MLLQLVAALLLEADTPGVDELQVTIAAVKATPPADKRVQIQVEVRQVHRVILGCLHAKPVLYNDMKMRQLILILTDI